MTRECITHQVKEPVRRIDPEAKVILFGSKTRGNAKEDSDWDFLILTSQRVFPFAPPLASHIGRHRLAGGAAQGLVTLSF